MKRVVRLALVSVCAFSSLVAAGCGGGDEPYKPAPAFSGRKVNLPAPPTLPATPIKVGDAFTIYGAQHHLKSRIHDKEVTSKDIVIQGYIGKKDADDCNAEIPSFWIADQKGETKVMVRVLGWSKNFASVFEAMEKYKNLKEPPKELFKDEIWGVEVPFPIPAVGAKVKITGKYGTTFSKSSTGIVSDPNNGVLTYGKMEVLEPASEPAAFKNKK
jgi:hypothetical protein